VIDGLTRDAARITAMGFPVFAAGFCPLDSKGRLDCISHGAPVRVGGCVVRPGDWLFGDVDGLVVVPVEVADEAFTLALAKARGENRVRDELARGRSLREVFAEYGIL
jgi:regulator of RNase E activity RraA